MPKLKKDAHRGGRIAGVAKEELEKELDTNKPEALFDFIKNSDDVAAYNIAKSLLND